MNLNGVYLPATYVAGFRAAEWLALPRRTRDGSYLCLIYEA